MDGFQMSEDDRHRIRVHCPDSAWSNDAGFGWNGLPLCPQCDRRDKVGSTEQASEGLFSFECVRCEIVFDVG